MSISKTVVDRIELEAQAVTLEWGEDWEKLPKGYLDGMLWAFDLVLMWIREDQKKLPKEVS